jgi:hypothetical protein
MTTLHFIAPSQSQSWREIGNKKVSYLNNPIIQNNAEFTALLFPYAFPFHDMRKIFSEWASVSLLDAQLSTDFWTEAALNPPSATFSTSESKTISGPWLKAIPCVLVSLLPYFVCQVVASCFLLRRFIRSFDLRSSIHYVPSRVYIVGDSGTLGVLWKWRFDIIHFPSGGYLSRVDVLLRTWRFYRSQIQCFPLKLEMWRN